MEEPKQEAQSVIGEYQGKPIIRIQTVDNPNPETTWHWLSFGKNKAKAIVKYYEATTLFQIAFGIFYYESIRCPQSYCANDTSFIHFF